ncbi:MAG: hypothetical protein Q7V88_17460 [Actinomycetota bacterium]|nr:hypothetical protein [Actinomycetota bacterium]
MSSVDRTALWQGASVALAFGVPLAIASAWVNSSDPDSPWTAVLWLGALGGFVLGAGVAAWVQRTGFPLMHALVCAAGTYLVAQGISSVIRMARGKPVSWLAIFFTFTTVLFAGLIGGALGSAMRKRGIMPSGKGRS